jgi:hypothetical protein
MSVILQPIPLCILTCFGPLLLLLSHTPGCRHGRYNANNTDGNIEIIWDLQHYPINEQLSACQFTPRLFSNCCSEYS